MADGLSEEESAKVMAVATDMRPDENFHDDPELGARPVAKGRDVTEAESAAIFAMAMDVRPFENFHPEDDADTEGEGEG